MADRLFEQGKELMDRGQYGEACRDFEASAAIDPGIGTRLWLADCYESQGRYANARILFQAVAADALRAKDKRESLADERARALDRKVAFYVVRVAALAAGEKVECDGAAFRPDEGPLAVDPGRHVLIAHAPGHDVWETSFTAVAGTTSDIDVPALHSQQPPPQPLATRAPPVPSPPVDGSSAWRTVGIAGTGVGVLGLGAGLILAVVAIHDHNRSTTDGCSPAVCTPSGHDDEERAIHEGNAATGALVAGGALVVAGAILYFVAPSTRATGWIGPRSASLAARF
jgi:serine/threonine-protein kinase